MVYNNEKILEALLAITQISNKSSLTFEEKINELLIKVVQCMNTEKGSIMLLKNPSTLEVVASTNPRIVGAEQSIDSESPSAWVIKNKKPLCVDKSDSDGKFGKKKERYKKDAFLLAPISIDEKIMGVLSVTEKKDDDSFSKLEQDLLITVTTLVIGTIENNRLNNNLRKLEMIRTELFNMLVHDLKGPISEIVANLDILSYTLTQEDDLEYLGAARKGCDNLFRMISDLLDIARLEEGSLKLIYESIYPEEVADEIVTRLYRVASSKSIKITQGLKTAEGHRFSADKQLVIRIFQNLVINAIEHSEAEKNIEIGYEMPDEHTIRFYVKDQGPGIAKDMQERIFDKFFQAKKKREGIKYTTGLGLNFCKLAVDAHKGRIYVESDGESGSCFSFELPVEKEIETE